MTAEPVTDIRQSEIIAEDLPMHAEQLEQYQHLGLTRRDAFALEGLAARIISRQRRAVLEIGRDLASARDVAQYGTWGPFLARVGMEERTARNYMSVFRRFGEQPEIISALPPTALYRLAAPGADPDVVDAIVSEVEAGARPTVAEVVNRLDAAAAPEVAPALPMFPEEELAAAPAPVAVVEPPPPAAPARTESATRPAPKPAAPAPAPATPPAPAATMPPPLTPLAPAQPAAPVSAEVRKLLAAKRALLDAALALVEEELERTAGPTVVVHHERALESARMFLASPAFAGAAAMLAFSALVEEAA